MEVSESMKSSESMEQAPSSDNPAYSCQGIWRPTMEAGHHNYRMEGIPGNAASSGAHRVGIHYVKAGTNSAAELLQAELSLTMDPLRRGSSSWTLKSPYTSKEVKLNHKVFSPGDKTITLKIPHHVERPGVPDGEVPRDWPLISIVRDNVPSSDTE